MARRWVWETTEMNRYILSAANYLLPFVNQRLNMLHETYKNIMPAGKFQEVVAEAVNLEMLRDAVSQFVAWANQTWWVEHPIDESDDGEEVDEHRWAERNADIGDMYEEARK